MLDEAAFELTLRAVTGEGIIADGLAGSLSPATLAELRVCADDITYTEAGSEGILLVGPVGVPRMIGISVQWQTEGSSPPTTDIFLPALGTLRD